MTGRQLGQVVLVSCFVLVSMFASSSWGAMVKDPGSPIWTNHIHRLNFGMAAYKLQRACVADGYWYHTFTFSLPPRVSDEDLNGTRAEKSNCTGECLRIEGLFNTTTALTRGMRRSIKMMVDKIYDLIPDLRSTRRNGQRPVRGLLDLIGQASSYLFGTATEGDVNQLKEEIRGLKAIVDGAAADTFHLKDNLRSFDKLINERLDGMHDIMEQESRSIAMMFNSMKSLHETVNIEINAISHSIYEIAKFVEIHDSVMQLELGIEDPDARPAHAKDCECPTN